MNSETDNLKIDSPSTWMNLESEEHFKILIDQSPFPIELLMPDGKIAYVNPAYLRLWDLTEDAMMQVAENYNILKDEQIVNLGLMPLVEKAFQGESVILPAVQYSASQTMEDFGLPMFSESEPWIQGHLYPIKDANGEIKFVGMSYVDLTAIKKVEAQMVVQREKLMQFNRVGSLGHLAGSIAHELNQPLTGILSHAQAAQILMQQDKWDKEQLMDAMVDIEKDTKRAADVLHNLRELYGTNKVEFVPLDINKKINDTIRLLQSEFVIQHTRVSTNLAKSLSHVSGNRIQIQQVLLNLLLNSLKAIRRNTKNNRRIVITSKQDDNEIRVWVDDNGTGIKTEFINRIFDPMVTYSPGGTGMGLAISHSIIESHNGRMWAENREGGGARIGFVLPVKNEDLQS